MAIMRIKSERVIRLNEMARSRQAFIDAPNSVAPTPTPLRKYPSGTTSKPCTKCGLLKPLEAFGPHKCGALGLNPKCRECCRKDSLKYTKDDREGKAARPRPTHCECCREPNTTRRALHWDHDHVTGEFRGWLCHHCNIALGAVDDSIPLLEQLIAYIKRGGGPS